MLPRLQGEVKASSAFIDNGSVDGLNFLQAKTRGATYKTTVIAPSTQCEVKRSSYLFISSAPTLNRRHPAKRS